MIFRTYYHYLDGWPDELLPFESFEHDGTKVVHAGFCVTVSNGLSQVFNFASHNEACFYAHCAAAELAGLPPHWKDLGLGFVKSPYHDYLEHGRIEIERFGSNFIVWSDMEIMFRGNELGARLKVADMLSKL